MTDPPIRDLVVIGGCGHVGLPLAIAFADRGADVGIYDVSADAVASVNAGRMPFAEPGAAPALVRSLAAGRLQASTDPAMVATAEHLIVVIGTPVDGHLNPDQWAIPKVLNECSRYFTDGQILILRSTVYPGATALVEKIVSGLGLDVDVAFCPGTDRRGPCHDRAVRAAASRVRRGPVPVQGHHAAGRLQQQQLRPRPQRRWRSTRPCRCTWCTAWSSGSTCAR